jgi:hypothetical protein
MFEDEETFIGWVKLAGPQASSMHLDWNYPYGGVGAQPSLPNRLDVLPQPVWYTE